jgi:L-threonylcarbamoyladenylate synthase
MDPQAAKPLSTGLKTRLIPASPEAAETAARVFAAGGLVAFPTETVYGLGADAGNGEAVARLYAAKARPAFNPLIAHVPDLEHARKLAVFNPAAETLARAFWPGPLTLVLPKRADSGLSDLACAGLDSVAIRVPAHPVARAILKAFGKPVVAPSANRSGHVSPTSAAHVLADLDGRIDLIVDGGVSDVGVESSIVSCLGAPAWLRPGGVPRDAIEKALGVALASPDHGGDGDAPLAPGMLESHYAPRSDIRLNATTVAPGEALLAFGPPLGSDKAHTLNLSPQGSLIEAAANLFSHLRALDTADVKTIAVMPIPSEGLGEAINDRLRRAAAPRP